MEFFKGEDLGKEAGTKIVSKKLPVIWVGFLMSFNDIISQSMFRKNDMKYLS